jgi:hypothetical protein
VRQAVICTSRALAHERLGAVEREGPSTQRSCHLRCWVEPAATREPDKGEIVAKFVTGFVARARDGGGALLGYNCRLMWHSEVQGVTPNDEPSRDAIRQDLIRRKGPGADQPHRIAYKKVVRA